MAKIKHIYLVHTNNGYIGGYLAGEKPLIYYAPCKDFIKFVEKLHKKHPDFKQIYVLNDGIVEAVERKIKDDLMLSIRKNKENKNN